MHRQTCSLFFYFVALCILCDEIFHARGDAVRDIYNAIYEDIDDSIPCVRLLNTTSTVGCSTSRSGVLGILRYFDSYDDIKKFKDSSHLPNEDVIAVLNSTIISSEVIEELYATQKVAGIILLEGPPPSRAVGFSPDSKFSNQNSRSFVWNPKGNGLLFRNIPLPIFTVNSNKSEEIRQRALYNDAANTYPYWAAELTAWMHGNENSDVCLRRGLCLPLAGHSVWTSLWGPLNTSLDFVVAVTTMDSASLFQQRNIGAESDMSNLIATLAALDALSHFDISNITRQIIFMFFDGESWGYLGSSKFIHDILNFSCAQYNENKTACLQPYYPSLEFLKLSLSKIRAIIELKQVGNRQNDGRKQLYVHQNRHDQSNSVVRTVFAAAATMSGQLSVSMASNQTPGIPPSSLTQFISAQSDFESRGVVITDHFAEYINPFYHSHFDTIHNIDSELVCNAATLLARSLLQLATTSTFNLSAVTANCSLVLSLIDCFTTNVTCSLLIQYIPELRTAVVRDPTPSHYVGVWGTLSLTSRFIHDFVFYATHYNRQPSRCNQTQDCQSNLGEVCLLGQCVLSATYYHDAISVGLSYDPNASPQWKITDPTLPNWTEPYWGPIGMRLFLYGNFVVDVIFFFMSLVELAISFGGLLLAKKFCAPQWRLLLEG
jgi:nicastrin